MEHQYLENIKPGMEVVIQNNRFKIVRGIVQEIAARKPFSEEGIMVLLSNGEVGRVKKILLNVSQINDKNADELQKLLKDGEGFHVEFKAESLWSVNFPTQQMKESKSPELREFGIKASKVILAKSIAAFLNSEGGNLIIGVKEKKDDKEKNAFDIMGIDHEFTKLNQPGIDSYRRMLIDEVIRPYFPPRIYNHLNNYLTIEFISLNEKLICLIKIHPSDSRVFLRLNDRDAFMIRVDSENRTLEGEKLVDYCIRKWGAR